MIGQQHPVARLLVLCAQARENQAVRALDELTAWSGFAEMAADAVGRPLVRGLIAAMARGRQELVEGLRDVIAALEAGEP